MYLKEISYKIEFKIYIKMTKNKGTFLKICKFFLKKP